MNNIKKYFSDNEKKIILLEEIDSTNNYAKKLALNGEPAGTVIIADSQTSGKGRLGRSFFSPKGTSIYMSIILHPKIDPEKSVLITPAAAVAAARAIDKICGIDTKIKWVNDLYLNGKKICGILTESSLNSMGKLNFAVIGIGVNVRSIKHLFPKELLDTASSIEDETGLKISLEALAAQIIKELDIIMPSIYNGEFIDEYRKRMCIIGWDVEVEKSGVKSLAKAVGISDSGGLIVEYNNGSRETVTSGEASIIKRGNHEDI